MQLPIDNLIPDILDQWPQIQNFLVSASPGSGKTTRLPPALLKVIPLEKQIWVLVPRRLAALLAAKRVADENNWQLGLEVGYHFRFEHCACAQTRLLFLTEGIFLKRLQSDADLKNVSCIILDEFHERHIDTDLAISLCRSLQKKRRPDLKIGVMSATIEAEPLKNFLKPLNCFDLQSPPYPLEIKYLAPADKIESSLLLAVKDVLKNQDYKGHILAFLPGIQAIQKCQQNLESLGNLHLEILPLHGELSPKEQSAILKPGHKRKIILATNIAESSVTLDGVSVVIDSGLYRRASYSWWTGISTLVTRTISKASAIQRAGRANRQGPGLCIRLYTLSDYQIKPDYEVPEIRRADLTAPLLSVMSSPHYEADFAWFDAPPDQAMEHAEQVLFSLEALKGEAGDWHISPLGRDLLALPLHPRLARIMVEARKRNCEEEAAVFVTHLLLKTYSSGYLFDAKPMRHNPIWVRQFEQLKAGGAFSPGGISSSDLSDWEACFLAGFPDFVGQIKKSTHKDGFEVLMCQGGRALLKSDFPKPENSLVLILDVMESKRGTYQKIHVDAYIPIEKDLIIKQSPLLKDEVILKWNEKLGRVDEVYQVHYGALLLEEENGKASPGPLTAEVLMKQGLGMTLNEILAWPDLALQFSLLAKKINWEAGSSLLARLYWLSQSDLIEKGADLTKKIVHTLKTLCAEVTSLNELKEKMGSFVFYFDSRLQQLLKEETPEFIALPGKPRTPVQYSLEKPPFIESRMQDFFGLSETPKILRGQMPLTCHLLAPNYRAVQVTQDLKGFWQKVYPEIKIQLQRRYPRHKWI